MSYRFVDSFRAGALTYPEPLGPPRPVVGDHKFIMTYLMSACELVVTIYIFKFKEYFLNVIVVDGTSIPQLIYATQGDVFTLKLLMLRPVIFSCL